MRTRKALHRLVVGPRPAPGRVFFSDVWSSVRTNQRYAELVPRLERVDPYLIRVWDRKIIRGVEHRVLNATRDLRHRLMLGAAARRYRGALMVDLAQVPFFDGSIVVDLDDPRLSAAEVEALNSPRVRAYVVTTERIVRGFEELGVEKPYHVVPQGVDLASIEAGAVADVAARHRRDGEVVFGYMGAWLLSGADRNGADPIGNIDPLLDLWDEIRGRVRGARLWLVGGIGSGLRRRCRGRDDILLTGWHPHPRALAFVANFDVALYRPADAGFRAIKVADYMGCGVPTVSYDYEVVEDLREAGAGLLARTPREFVDAAERLATDDALRSRIGAAARAAGSERDWGLLATRYAELLDRYLTPVGHMEPTAPGGGTGALARLRP